MTPTHDEPPAGGAGDEGPDGAPDDAEGHPHGWISPEDRLWRHPSELAGGLYGDRSGDLDGDLAALLAPPAGSHRRSRLMLVVGAAAALAGIAWAAILLSPASDHPIATTSRDVADSPMTTLAGAISSLPKVTDAASRAMVVLRAVTTHGTSEMVGVAVAEGGLVATTADGLKGLRSIDMVGPDGHLIRASVVGTDGPSDLALVNVPDDLPVAPFADDDALVPGSADFVLDATPTDGAVALRCTPGAVTAIGSAISAGPAAGMPAITSDTSGTRADSGDLLLNSSGSVVGILYGDQVTTPTFLPSQLVLGVADDLRSASRVVHGWLGVDGTDVANTYGARVAAVAASGPAAGLLQPGEVITSIGSLPVRSMAELRARLYVLAPRTTVAISVLEGSVTRVVDVTLSPSP